MTDVEVEYTVVFEKTVESYESGKYRLIAHEGSTRSTKTYSNCQFLSLYVPHKYKKSISIVSPSLPHLKRGARRDFLEILDNANLYDDNSFNKTDQVYHYPNGSYAEFFGAEDAGKVRGPGRDILYVNEANLLPYSIYKQLALRTKEIIIIDYNPADENSWVYDEADKPGNILIHSTYKDNPYLSKQQISEIEGLKDADENLWKVFGLGLRGTSSETIWTHWKPCSEMPYGETAYGLDFGFNHPTALIKIVFNDGNAYVQELIYENKLTTNELADRMKEFNIGYDEIFCDHSRPETIEELARCGLNVKKANKDVVEGIRKVKSMPVYVTNDSTNLIKELRNYKWKVDKEGKVLDEPVKFNDDACDALRYGLYSKLANPEPEYWAA
jgi:phage terminase large subunit